MSGHVHSCSVHSQSPSLPLGQAFPTARKTLPETGWTLSRGLADFLCGTSRVSERRQTLPRLGLGPRTSEEPREPASTSQRKQGLLIPEPSLLRSTSHPLFSLLFPLYSGREGGAEAEGREEGWGQLVPGAKLLTAPSAPPGLAAAKGISRLRSWHSGTVEGHFNVYSGGLAPSWQPLANTPVPSNTQPAAPDLPAAKVTHRPAPQTRQLSDAFENGECQPRDRLSIDTLFRDGWST